MEYRSLAKRIAIAALLLLGGCGSPQERALKAVTRFEQYYAARDFVDARAEIQKAIAIEDDVAEYWTRLGRAELGLRNYFPAYSAYQRALELDKGNKEALQAMAELAYSGGKPRDAGNLADQMLEKEPRNLRMLLVKGAIAVDDKDYPAGKQFIGKMLEIDPDNEGAIVLLGRVLFQTGEGARGAKLIEGSIAKLGPSPLKLALLIDIYTAGHDLDGITRSYRRMFAIDRRSVGLRLDYAKALYENDEPGRALVVIDQLQRARPHDNDLKKQIVELWDMVGSDAVDLDQVRRFADAGNDEMKLALARLAIEQGRFAEALQIVKPFITDDKITPENVVPQMLYAQAQSGVGQKAEGIARANRVLAFDSTNPEALILRVQIEIDRKDFPAALTDAQILERDNPDSDAARLALPHVYMAKADRIMADTSFARALGDIPDSVAIMDEYSDWLVTTGRPAMALDVARRFTRSNGRSLRGWESRARLCLDLKNRECLEEVADALDRTHGGEKMRATVIAAMQTMHAT